MKRVLFSLVFFILVSFVSALPEISVYNELPFQPYETITGNISGVNQTLSVSDLKFFEGRREVSVEKNLISYGGNYYFSAIFNREGNFSLVLENSLYYEGSILKSVSVEKNFEIFHINNSSQVLSIKPGVIFTTKDFELTLTNKGKEQVNSSYGKKNKSSLDVGESEKIVVSPGENFYLFEIDSYKKFFIPIVYLKINEENETIEEKILSLRIAQKQIQLEGNEGEKLSYTLELFNFGKENLTDISIKSNLSFLKFGNLGFLPGKTAMNVSIEGTPKEKGLFEDNLTVVYSENGTKEKIEVPIVIYVFQENASEEEIKKSLDCFDLGGVVCSIGEICGGTFSDKIEGCCMGLCEDTKKESSGNVIVGLLILGFLGAVGFVIYKKFKNVKPKSKITSS